MPIPVISAAQMREWETATWASGRTEAAVIARVGEFLARRALTLTRPDEMIVLLAGPGHNGDDVRAMQAHLHARDVKLLNVINPEAALAEVIPLLEQSPALIVDGLFGSGLSRPLADDWRQLVTALNSSPSPILAVDVPSGLDAGTGQPLPDAIHAALTITIGAPKRGLLHPSAASFVGRLEVATDVGLAQCPCQSELQWTLPEDFASYPPRRPSDGHKGIFGHAAVVAGSLGYHGAAVLAARGAQRARPGLVTLFTQADVFTPVAAQLQAAMVQPWHEAVYFSKFTSVLFGPGLAAENLNSSVWDTLQELWRNSTAPIIVDATALEWLPRSAPKTAAVRVITPHPGEAARLLGCDTKTVQQDRVAALRVLAKQFNCWVVLKGRHTLVGRAEGDLFVNSSGSPDLAQGGSGDLLAGYIAGTLAQPSLQSDPSLALRHAVFEHGAAADRLSARPRRWIVEELAEELGSNDCGNPDFSFR